MSSTPAPPTLFFFLEYSPLQWIIKRVNEWITKIRMSKYARPFLNLAAFKTSQWCYQSNGSLYNLTSWMAFSKAAWCEMLRWKLWITFRLSQPMILEYFGLVSPNHTHPPNIYPKTSIKSNQSNKYIFGIIIYNNLTLSDHPCTWIRSHLIWNVDLQTLDYF